MREKTGLPEMPGGAESMDCAAGVVPRAEAALWGEAARRPPSLKQLAIRGAAWTVAGYGASQVLRLGSSLILTRLLFPEAFGLMVLVHVIQTGLAMFSDVGINPSIIQNKRGEEPAFLNTAWTIQVVRGVVLWIICCILAYPVALFYGQPQLAQLLPVAGLTAVIGGFNSTSLPLANRRLALGRLTVLELATQVVSIAVMVAWAWTWPTVWALLAGSLIGSVLKMLATHIWLPAPACRLHWDHSAARALLTFGRWIFVTTMTTFLAGQADRLLFGHYLSAAELGVYAVGIGLALLPQSMSAAASRVVLPTFSRAVNEGHPLAHVFHRVRRPLLLLGAAGVLPLLAAGDWFVAFLYDPRYASAGKVTMFVAGASWFEILEGVVGAGHISRGTPVYTALANTTRFTLMTGLVVLGFRLGGLDYALGALVLASLAKYVVSAATLRRHHVNPLPLDACATLVLIAMAASARYATQQALASESSALARALFTTALTFTGLGLTMAIAYGRPAAAWVMRARATQAHS